MLMQRETSAFILGDTPTVSGPPTDGQPGRDASRRGCKQRAVETPNYERWRNAPAPASTQCNAYKLPHQLGPNVRHERRAKGREAAFGTSARWRG